MSFAAEIDAYARRLADWEYRLHSIAGDLVFESIVNGSPVTGAPGQPVDTGNLRASWQREIHGPLSQSIATNTVYAPAIEDGARGSKALTLRSQTGGFHSVKMTVAAWPRIVDEAERLAGEP